MRSVGQFAKEQASAANIVICRMFFRTRLRFHVEHILPRQHGGRTEMENLAWCCQRCNSHKGPNLTGVDPDTSIVVELFHPRRDRWEEHFLLSDLNVSGLTAKGRATSWLLEMNSEERLRWRSALRSHGLF